MTAGETQPALALGGSLQRFWYLRGHYHEARRRLTAALAADDRPTAARASVLCGATMFAVEASEIAAARSYAEEALAISERVGDAWAIALSKLWLAHLVREEGDFATALPMYEACARRFEELGDEHYVLLSRFHIAWMLEELGDEPASVALHEDNLHRARASSNKRVEGVTLHNLAAAAMREARYADALRLHGESFRISIDLNEPVEVADAVSRFARIHAKAGNAQLATRLLSCSEALREEIGADRSWVRERNQETLAIVRAQLGPEQFEQVWLSGRSLTADEAAGLALDALP